MFNFLLIFVDENNISKNHFFEKTLKYRDKKVFCLTLSTFNHCRILPDVTVDLVIFCIKCLHR